MPTRLPNGTLIWNVTPHELHFVHEQGEEGMVVIVPSDGTLNARPKTQEVLKNSRYTLVTVEYDRVGGGLDLLRRIRSQSPDGLVVGSIIAAQAYAGDVVAPIPYRGGRYSKDKLVRCDRFTVFQPSKEIAKHG